MGSDDDPIYSETRVVRPPASREPMPEGRVEFKGTLASHDIMLDVLSFSLNVSSITLCPCTVKDVLFIQARIFSPKN